MNQPAARPWISLLRHRLKPFENQIQNRPRDGVKSRLPGTLAVGMVHLRRINLRKADLDLLFADEHGRVIGIVANAEPYSQAPRGVSGDSQYVLEVNGGACRRLGINAGDRLEFIGFSPAALE